MQSTFIDSKYEILGSIDLDAYHDSLQELYVELKLLYRKSFLPNQRIVITSTVDYYKQDTHGILLQSVQSMINDIDISNCFICFVTTNQSIFKEYNHVLVYYSTDKVPFEIVLTEGMFTRTQDIYKRTYTKSLGLDKLESTNDLITKSKNFCILPWVSLMIGTNSKVNPCCVYTQDHLGDCSKDSFSTIWKNEKFQKVRERMLQDKPVTGCKTCINAEKLGKQSTRNSMNTRFSKYISLAVDTTPDYNIKYIDSRFNNLCNLSCRSCYPGASSSWHKPAVEVGLIDKNTPVFLKAGRNESDVFDQIMMQIDNLERIYFAGGEPLIIEDNYRILEELDKRGRHDIELIYNTNMNQSTLKGKSIFDSWKNFKHISIGASLDAEGLRGEYLRTGTVWKKVVRFRKQMLEQRPDIHFYISATTSIINVLHVPDFHRSWVEKKLINPSDFNIQTLFFPNWLSITTAPSYMRSLIIDKYNKHLDWLRPLDTEGKATVGFESIIKQLETQDIFDEKLFWDNINPLDKYYKADLFKSFPELVDLLR